MSHIGVGERQVRVVDRTGQFSDHRSRAADRRPRRGRVQDHEIDHRIRISGRRLGLWDADGCRRRDPRSGLGREGLLIHLYDNMPDRPCGASDHEETAIHDYPSGERVFDDGQARFALVAVAEGTGDERLGGVASAPIGSRHAR